MDTEKILAAVRRELEPLVEDESITRRRMEDRATMITRSVAKAIGCDARIPLDRLHDVTHGGHGAGINSYCGPAVYSAITGRTAEEGARAIAKVTGQRRPVAGVSIGALCGALRAAGYFAELAHTWPTRAAAISPERFPPVTADWLAKRKSWDRRVLILAQTRHLVACIGDTLVCSHHERGVDYQEASNRRRHLLAVLRVYR